MKHIIKKILKEEINSKVINLILNNLKSGRIKPPYFKNLKDLGLSDEEIEIVLSDYFNGEVNLKKLLVYNKSDDRIYREQSNGEWTKKEYDSKGNALNTYHVSSDGEITVFDKNNKITFNKKPNGDWVKQEFDSKGKILSFEDSDGYLNKWEYDSNGNLTHNYDNLGKWVKMGYDNYGNLIYKETSSKGVLFDER